MDGVILVLRQFCEPGRPIHLLHLFTNFVLAAVRSAYMKSSTKTPPQQKTSGVESLKKASENCLPLMYEA